MIKKSKKLITGLLLAASLVTIVPATTAFAWDNNDENKKYEDFLQNECKKTSDWWLYEKDGKYYGVNNGLCANVKPVGYFGPYYTDNNGMLLKNVWGQDLDGNWHYFDSDYKQVKKGYHTIDGKYYYFGQCDALYIGWNKHSKDDDPRAYWKDKHWYYNGEDGAIKQGWLSYNGKWYYIYSDGLMAYDTTTPDGYYVDKNGVWVP